MAWLRSIAFNGLFYTWTIFCSLFFLPLLLFPRSVVLRVTKIWIFGVVIICERILDLHIKVIGKEKLFIKPLVDALSPVCDIS